MAIPMRTKPDGITTARQAAANKATSHGHEAVCGQIRPLSLVRPVDVGSNVGSDTREPRLTFTQKKLLAAFAGCGSVSGAAAAVGSSRATHYKAMKRSATYREAFHQTEEEFIDLLRSTATHLAITGVRRKKFYRGRPCRVFVLDEDGNPVFDEFGEPLMEEYEEVVYNTRLLLMMMRAYCPEYAGL